MTLTVGQLKEQLDKYPTDMKVYLPSDEEGNSYNVLYELTESWFMEGDNAYDRTAVHPNDVGTEYEEEHLIKVVLLWP